MDQCGWSLVRFAAEMAECPDCGEPFCAECETHYSECDCIGPTEDGVRYKDIDGVLFAKRGTGNT
jgi:hypothetical protein